MTGWRRLSATQLITYEMTAAWLWRVIHQPRHPSQAWREHLLMAESQVVGIRLSSSSTSWLAGLTDPCDWKEITTSLFLEAASRVILDAPFLFQKKNFF